MIITLAGHVDHGKTSLVKALTGIETDVLRDWKSGCGHRWAASSETPSGWTCAPPWIGTDC